MDENYLHQHYGVRMQIDGSIKHDPQWNQWADQNPPVKAFERDIAAYLPKDGGELSTMAQGIILDFAKRYLDVCTDITESRPIYRVLMRLNQLPFLTRYTYMRREELIKECMNFEVRRYCETCHTPVYFQPSDIPARIFCEACQSEYRRQNPPLHTLKSMPYKDYLHTHHWRKVRDAALERSGHRCQVCNSGESLDVHHRTYERRGEEMPSDLTVLCEECHKVFHQNGRMPKW